MNSVINDFCCACLCPGRRMVVIKDRRSTKLFHEIIDDAVMCGDALSLCWECSAHLDRFTKFSRRAKRCYEMFHASLKQNKDIIPHESQLQTHTVLSLTITPNEADTVEETFEIICPMLTPTITVIKEELPSDNCSDHFSEDDNSLLINLKKKKKKVKKPSRCKMKQIYQETYTEIILNKDEIEEERRQLKLKDNYVNAMFRCEKCILSFPNADDLNDHETMKHDEAATYQCDVCNRSFNTEVSYNYHKNKHLKRYECIECAERFHTKRAAARHYDTVHNRIDVQYDADPAPVQNGEVSATKVLLEDTNATSGLFECDACDKKFRWKTSLRKHAETHRIETGQKRRPYCESCRLSFTTTSNLQKHVKTSSKHQIQLKLRKLSLPEDSTPPEKKKAHIEQIKRSVNGARQCFSCGQCGKQFQWRGNLLRHLHSHTARAKGELVCEPCNRTFSSIATFKQHMKISKKHVSEDDFKYMCSDCGKRFANKTRLKDHINWEHLKQFLHRCEECGKAFKSHTSLYLHRGAVHSGASREHLCDHCGRAFPNQAKLRSHILALHTSEAPYACAWCGARFSWHSCLSRHVRRLHAQDRHAAPPGKG